MIELIKLISKIIAIVSFIYALFFFALPDFKIEKRKIVTVYLGITGFVTLPIFLLVLDGTSLVLGIVVSIIMIAMAFTLYYDIAPKVKNRIKYLLADEVTKFYLDYQKNRRGEVLQDYDEIQTMISYVVDNKLQKHQYATFIAHLYYGYYKMLFDKEKTRFYHSYKDSELYVVRKGLKMSALNPFDTDKYDTDEIEILVTKYKTSIDIIRSMIGKELNEETKQRIEDILQLFAEDLEKGIEEVQRAKEMIKKQEHEAYELEQKRLQELLENEINWLRSDK